MMRRPTLIAMSALAAFVLLAVVWSPVAAQGPRPRPQTWVDGERFDGVVTPATFDPAKDPFDQLYAIGDVCKNPMMGDSFKLGVPLISESKPGDQDYNGGRWHLNVLKANIDCDKYEEADSLDDLTLSDFMSTSDYFECPLLPRRGGR